MSTFAPHPLWGQGATPAQPVPDLPSDLPGVADLFETAIEHLLRGELTAGSELTITALRRFRSLLGEPDLVDLTARPYRSAETLAEDVGAMVAGVLIGLYEAGELADELANVERDLRALGARVDVTA